MFNTVQLANQLEKVIAAKERYDKEREIYRKLALENGVTEEAVNYILMHPAGGTNE